MASLAKNKQYVCSGVSDGSVQHCRWSHPWITPRNPSKSEGRGLREQLSIVGARWNFVGVGALVGARFIMSMVVYWDMDIPHNVVMNAKRWNSQCFWKVCSIKPQLSGSNSLVFLSRSAPFPTKSPRKAGQIHELDLKVKVLRHGEGRGLGSPFWTNIETMVETTVCWHLRWGIESFRGF